MSGRCEHNQYGHCVWCVAEAMAPEVPAYPTKRKREGAQKHYAGCWRVHSGCSQYCARGPERTEDNVSISVDKRTGGSRMTCRVCKATTTRALRERQRKELVQ